MYKMYCDQCEHRFHVTDEILKKFIEDIDSVLSCPMCNSLDVNILECGGQQTGY